MKILTFAGGRPAPAGLYREVRSGQVIRVGHGGVLPGQPNSDLYVRLPGVLPNGRVHRPALRSEQA